MVNKLEDFIKSNQNNLYGITGYRNTYGPYILAPMVHLLHSEDFFYNEETNVIYLNIGNYSDKNLTALLDTLFIPFDELSTDLIKEIKERKITLILDNKIANQKPDFFKSIDKFFKNKDINIKKQGIWK